MDGEVWGAAGRSQRLLVPVGAKEREKCWSRCVVSTRHLSWTVPGRMVLVANVNPCQESGKTKAEWRLLDLETVVKLGHGLNGSGEEGLNL